MNVTLEAKSRTLRGRKLYLLRSEGQVPAVVYGSNTEPRSIAVDQKALWQTFHKVGESALIDLSIDGGAPLKVLIQEIQYHPLRDDMIHADFRSVDVSQEITAEVKLHFIGESMAVKGLGGVFVHPKDTIEVRALPQNLVAAIEVDITNLKTFDDAIQIADIIFPPGVVPVDPLETTIAVVAPPRSEEELADLNKAVEADVNTVEVVKKEKKEEKGK